MATVTKYPTANQAAGGAFNGAWTNPNNAHADDGVFATAAPGKNQEFASVWSVPFTTSDIPDGSTINSVTVEVQWKVSTTSSVATLRSTAYADSAQLTALSAVPGVSDTAEPTVETIRSYASTATLAQLRDLWIRSQALRGNSNTAVTGSLDFVRVTVDYTEHVAQTIERSASFAASSSIATASTFFSTIESGARFDASAGVGASGQFFSVIERSTSFGATASVAAQGNTVHVRGVSISAASDISASGGAMQAATAMRLTRTAGTGFFRGGKC